MFTLPSDYLERVYAGVLGKLIGVYLGRPFEGWTHQRIMAELGPIHYYVHERLNVPLVVTDDDVSGTFAFVRALEEHGVEDISSEAIGKTWLNGVVEKQSVFWWGGRGISTEHTAWLNLKHGICAPHSGSIEVNGQTIAEQIGAQIFIDGWALVSAARPALAAHLAQEAGRVSHDGESVYAAMVWAAMEAEAFVSKDVEHLIDTGLSFVPHDSLISRVIADVRRWVETDGGDWLTTRQRIEDTYGYDKYPGACHVIPNHSIMIMALLYAGDDFSRAMHIINTCGWDTDCNSGNVGCLVAIMHGMDSFSGGGPDWRGPIADRALISSSDNGYSINNAPRIALDIANMGRRLAGKAPLPAPKNGAQFHFTLPGSVQGFRIGDQTMEGSVSQAVENDEPGLRIEFGAQPVEVVTPTAAPKELLVMPAHYSLTSSPLVYPGQRVTVSLRSDARLSHPVQVRIRAKVFNWANDLVPVDSAEVITLKPGDTANHQLEWTLPAVPESYPIAELGLFVSPSGVSGCMWLNSLWWDGVPDLTVERPRTRPHLFWDLAWIKSVSTWSLSSPIIHIAQDSGEGIVSYGTREWTDYQVTVHDLSVKLGAPAGVAIRVQGLRRYYALVFTSDGHLALVKALDERRIELAKVPFRWVMDAKYEVKLQADGRTIRGSVGDVTVHTTDDQYEGGAVGLVVTDGAMSADKIKIQPISRPASNGDKVP